MSISPWDSSCFCCLPCGALDTEWRATNIVTMDTQAETMRVQRSTEICHSIKTDEGIGGGNLEKMVEGEFRGRKKRGEEADNMGEQR